MIFRLFILIIGFGIAVSGGISTIAYLNLLTTGHGLMEYLSFITHRAECYLLPIGIVVITISIYFPKRKEI
ncbi:hypothetical protein SM124_01145 [Bacillus sp. 31A1R]|uniref:Uncharacterized protein n=1 Tax=Robertmurraya mangrovi TaxID=3098077 RepID=A0ABU5IT69_9BACI|nr:hypothetical protein [Bacillus sp. 31A1R]MDZ5470343.1 hypothetical protein [Bacillus sp. 31A1R]